MTGDPLGAVFFALADPTRRRVLERLCEAGPATPTQLAAGLPVTRQAVTKHLGLLGAAGLVSCQRVGREARYSATTVPLTEVVAWLGRVGSEWDARLDALRELLDPSG